MIVQCDKCGAKFQLADDKITDKGAKVRCSKCKAVFTVARDKGADKPEAPAKAKAPAAPKPPAPPAGSGIAAGKEPDPFSDFSFDDQLDFAEGSEEVTVEAPAKPKPAPAGKAGPPPPPAVGPSFMDESPAVDAQGGVKEEDADGGFDFSEDEDFSFADDASGEAKAPAPDEFGEVSFDEPAPAKPAPAKAAPSKPAPPKAAPPKPAPPPPAPAPGAAKAPAKPGGKTDDFGDFKFDDDSFAEGGAAPAAPAPAPSDAEWGNVSFDAGPGGAGAAASGGADDVIDEAGFGDFQFDSGGEGTAKASSDDDVGMDLAQDFVRSPTSKAPVRDDLEASIGEGEAPSERDRSRERDRERDRERKPAPAADAPPPPRIAHSKDKGGGGMTWVIVIIILLGAGGGAGYMFREDLMKLIKSSGGPVDEGNWALSGKPQIKSYIRAEGEQQIAIVAATGNVKNASTKAKTGVLVKVTISYTDESGAAHKLSGQSHCGVVFEDAELTGRLSRASIERDMNTVTGRSMRCLQVPSGESRPYTVVFFDLPTAGKISISPDAEAEIVPEEKEGAGADAQPGATAP